ncbi:hypothetical protein [Lacrimispora indolis]|uniref:hypothetical protein n=1 Tax=Lacrimispora indolis TaxID=69825 RepID=UPI000462564E|nr:hypothetical protein [[Clostridium] methoxybenzovorans]
MNKKGFVKRGDIIVGMNGAVCCPSDDCPHLDCIGRCTDINAKCVYEKQRHETLLQCMFDNDEIGIELRRS